MPKKYNINHKDICLFLKTQFFIVEITANGGQPDVRVYPPCAEGPGPPKARQGQFHGDKEEKGDTFEEGTHLNPLRGPMHGTADGGAGSSRERDTKRAGAGHGDCGRAQEMETPCT